MLEIQRYFLVKITLKHAIDIYSRIEHKYKQLLWYMLWSECYINSNKDIHILFDLQIPIKVVSMLTFTGWEVGKYMKICSVIIELKGNLHWNHFNLVKGKGFPQNAFMLIYASSIKRRFLLRMIHVVYSITKSKYTCLV